jgi:hypothetical protein
MHKLDRHGEKLRKRTRSIALKAFEAHSAQSSSNPCTSSAGCNI